jgi:hypothetical protein
MEKNEFIFINTLGSRYPDTETPFKIHLTKKLYPETEIQGIKLSATGLGVRTFCLFFHILRPLKSKYLKSKCKYNYFKILFLPIYDKVRIVVVLHPMRNVLSFNGLQFDRAVSRVGTTGIDAGGWVSGAKHLVFQTSMDIKLRQFQKLTLFQLRRN